MQIGRRTLYNLMRMNWLADSSIAAEPWQVEDYRSLSLERIFERLNAHDIRLDRNSFWAFAAEVDTPEELTDFLLDGSDADVVVQDQVYLLIFELWRRLITDRPSLSIFCDELDRNIYLYDNHLSGYEDTIEDVIANLQGILDENSDQGSAPHEVFETISGNCANDVESFLYDYILEQLQEGNEGYASELIEGFSPYVHDRKWFSLLRVELQSATDLQAAQPEIRRLIDLHAAEGDVEFNLELLTFMVKKGRQDLFLFLVQKTLPLIEVEEEFRTVLTCCVDFLQMHHKDVSAAKVQKMLTKRSHFLTDSLVSKKEPLFVELIDVLKGGE